MARRIQKQQRHQYYYYPREIVASHGKSEVHPVVLGDHLVRVMTGVLSMFYHHGIVSALGHGTLDTIMVIHWKMGVKQSLPMRVQETTLRDFLHHKKHYYIYRYAHHLVHTPEETVTLARQFLNNDVLTGKYHFIFENCESLCYQCKLKVPPYRTHLPASGQSLTVAKWALTILGVGATLCWMPRQLHQIAHTMSRHVKQIPQETQSKMMTDVVHVLSPHSNACVDSVTHVRLV